MITLKKRLTSVTSTLSTLTLSFLPVLKCPPCLLCMPKYAAILSFLGLELADYSHYLMPIMWLSMLVTVVSLKIQGPRYYGHAKPAFLAIIASLLILLGREKGIDLLTYAGMGSLLIGMIWHQIAIAGHKHTNCKHK